MSEDTATDCEADEAEQTLDHNGGIQSTRTGSTRTSDSGSDKSSGSVLDNDDIGDSESGPDGSFRRRQIGLWGGVVVFGLLLLLPAPRGLSPEAWRTAAVGGLMACWWITEALPIATTALIPLVAFPVLGVRSITDAAAPYANPLIFLFMGGFVLAVAMQRWDLHRRIALSIVRWVGTRPNRIVIGFILASAFLSMWVSNTATALMMLPIGLSVITLTKDRLRVQEPPTRDEDSARRPFNFGLVLVLAIAYACNVGGMGTLIGTPPNALLAGFMSESYGIDVGFAQWMAVGLPLVAFSLPLVYAVLTWVFPIHLQELPGGAQLIEEELRKLGPASVPEKRVAWVFGSAAVLWIFRPLLSEIVPGLSDAGIAMGAALSLFIIPAGLHEEEERRRILNWEEAESLPWGVLLLFGGGLSLAAAISGTGLAEWIGQSVEQLEGWPILLVLLVVVTLIVFLTEITSNTATTAAFLPILGAVAVGIGQNPFLLVVPAALAASCAFMLPVATPPNAIVYGSGLLTIPQMSRAGLWLNVLFIFLVSLFSYTLLGLVFSVQIGELPPWAG